MILAETQSVPMTIDSHNVIRVGGTRVRLDTVVYAFNEGNTAEEIVSQYPALNLADVYAVIAYYLNNRSTIDEYIANQEIAANEIRSQIESRPEYKQFREQLLARTRPQQS